MRFSEWIKDKVEALQAIVGLEDDESSDDPAKHPAVQEIRTPDKLVLKFKSDPANVSHVRRLIEHFCENAGLNAPAFEEIGLVVNEALANIIRHAYHGDKTQPIQATVERFNDGVKISLRDWGNGVNPTAAPRPEHDPLQPGGLGLICIHRLMEQATYHPQPDGMLLVMTRTLNASKARANDKCEFP